MKTLPSLGKRMPPPSWALAKARPKDLSIPITSDRKSTRLNSSHLVISYAVFCLKKQQNSSSTGDLGDDPPFLGLRGGTTRLSLPQLRSLSLRPNLRPCCLGSRQCSRSSWQTVVR